MFVCHASFPQGLLEQGGYQSYSSQGGRLAYTDNACTFSSAHLSPLVQKHQFYPMVTPGCLPTIQNHDMHNGESAAQAMPPPSAPIMAVEDFLARIDIFKARAAELLEQEQEELQRGIMLNIFASAMNVCPPSPKAEPFHEGSLGMPAAPMQMFPGALPLSPLSNIMPSFASPPHSAGMARAMLEAAMDLSSPFSLRQGYGDDPLAFPDLDAHVLDDTTLPLRLPALATQAPGGDMWGGLPHTGLMHACSVTGAFLSPTMFMAAAAQEPAFAGLPISGVTLTSGSGVVGLGSPMSYLGNTNTYPTSMRQPYL